VLKSLQYDVNDVKSLWQIIVWRMKIHRIGPKQLAQLTSYSLAIIFKGINGEAALITDNFLRRCVVAFGLTDGRIDTNNPEDIDIHLTREECISILRPPPAMPSYNNNDWENDLPSN
jgi:hypothetical protein